MFSGNRAEVLSLWVVAIGIVLLLFGMVGLRSPRFTTVLGNPVYGALFLLGVGLAFVVRGLVMYRRAHRARQEADTGED
jgi:uncharacterized membrane protein HdeD (DUF308 family)